MQDTRSKRLKNDKRGVLDLPVKLMVVMIILALFLPMVANAVESNEKSMARNEMEQETNKFIDSVRMVHFSGKGSVKTVQISLPAGCEMVVGGDGSNAYAVCECFKGNELNKRFVESPAIKFNGKTTLTGECTVTLTNVGGGVPTVDVNVR